MTTEIKTQTNVGMTFQDNLPFEDWEQIGRRFGEASKRFSFALGDWLVYGSRQYKGRISVDTYQELEKMTGVDRQSLLSLVTLCKRIPQDQRNERLSLEQHQAIATINDEERRGKWLAFVGTLDRLPSKKLLKLSISCSPDEPKIITEKDYAARERKYGKDNYSGHLTRLITVLRKTIPQMTDFEIEALKTDTKGLIELIERL